MAAMRRVLDRDRSSSEELLQSKLIESLSRIDESMFITLEGSYNVWQEVSFTTRQQHQPLSSHPSLSAMSSVQVFSHVVDIYLLESSVRNMSTAAVLEAFRIAMVYDMKDLRKHYGAALARALSSDNFVKVCRKDTILSASSWAMPFPRSSMAPSVSTQLLAAQRLLCAG
jgi:uncharacterized protein YhhL (DUF1145 family)